MPRSTTPEESSAPAHDGAEDGAFGEYEPLGLLSSPVTRLNRFSPKACGLQPPCLRLTEAVADTGPRLGMKCVGSTLLQWLSQPPVTRRLVAHRISEQSGHPFRSKVATHFGLKVATIKISKILRLKHEAGLTNRQIAQSCGRSRSTIANYLERAEKAGLAWPLPDTFDEEKLHQLLFGDTPPLASSRPLPDMAHIHKELRRKHVTLQLLWEEYRAEHPDGYGYTQFCERYKRWKAPLEVTLRQRHIAGEKTFLDWGGKTLHWTNPTSGQAHPAFLFVAALGASDYIFAEAFADQALDSWIEAHIHMVEFYGGVTGLWVPDNAKTGVVKPCYYEPQIHDSYQELADHYNTAVLPTRTYRPRDKAKVENAVLHAERRIMARLRDQDFFSLGAINEGQGPFSVETVTGSGECVSPSSGAV